MILLMCVCMCVCKDKIYIIEIELKDDQNRFSETLFRDADYMTYYIHMIIIYPPAV